MTSFSPTCLLVTGGAGFIGSNFGRWVLEHEPNVTVVNLDLLTYAGNVESLEDVEQRFGRHGDGRYAFVRGDIRDLALVRALLSGDGGSPRPEAIVHLAAESHVDRSIMGPGVFVETNVTGTLTLLEACRAELAARPRPFRFLHVSTDEVYGTLGPSDPAFCETTPLAPNSPYSASKAASDLLVRAYGETFDLPAVITRCSNNYGPYQFPEKLIPLMITRALRDEPLPVYGDGMNGENEIPNLAVVRQLLALLGKPESLIRYVTDRPGHDRRYAMDASRLRRTLGWTPRRDFETGLAATVEWYLTHRTWWERVLSEAYRTAAAMYLVER